MQPRSLQAILSELDTTYAPQLDLVRQKQAAIPGAVQAEEQGLQAKQTSAFDEILGGARRRGLGFSGIPLGEQAKYNATEYMPALARSKQSARDQAMSLEEAILGINERRQQQAQGIYQYETSLAEQRRQFDQQMAEQRRQAAAAAKAAGGGGYSPSFGGLAGVQGAQASATMTQRKDKGFNFTDGQGRAINAAAYAQSKGIPFRTLLDQMAKAGDGGAKAALSFVGNDYGYDPRKVRSANLANLYKALTGRTASIGSAPVNLPAGLTGQGQARTINGLTYY